MADVTAKDGTMGKSDRSVKDSLNVSSGKFEVCFEKCTSFVATNVLKLDMHLFPDQ